MPKVEQTSHRLFERLSSRRRNPQKVYSRPRRPVRNEDLPSATVGGHGPPGLPERSDAWTDRQQGRQRRHATEAGRQLTVRGRQARRVEEQRLTVALDEERALVAGEAPRLAAPVMNASRHQPVDGEQRRVADEREALLLPIRRVGEADHRIRDHRQEATIADSCLGLLDRAAPIDLGRRLSADEEGRTVADDSVHPQPVAVDETTAEAGADQPRYPARVRAARGKEPQRAAMQEPRHHGSLAQAVDAELGLAHRAHWQYVARLGELMQRNRYHLAVLGAGSTGAATALFAAQAGLKVALLERRPIDQAGARWVNDVPAWMFERASLRDLPGSMACSDHTVRLVVPSRGASLAVRTDRVAAIDMRALGQILLDRAQQQGVTLYDDVGEVRVERDVVEAGGERVAADFIVDASGLAGLNLLGRSAAQRHDLCAAAQDMRIVKNLDQARAYFHAHGARDDDAVVTLCIAGGYSVLNLRLIGDQVFVLSGSIPALGHPSGRRVIDDFLQTQPWIGERLFGGERAIPLAPPIEPFVRGRHAQVGDAARQVFAAHGSGTGSGLVAARLLVDSLVATQGLEAYASAWYREFGATHFTYDLLRRASMTLHPEAAAALLRSQLLDEEGLRSSMAQRLPHLRARALLQRLGAARRAPEVAGNLAAFLRYAPLLAGLARAYPAGPRQRRLWHRALAELYRPIDRQTAERALAAR